MTHRERVLAALHNESVDQLPYQDAMWGETRQRYQAEGHLLHGEDAKLFDYVHSKNRKVMVHSCGFVEPLVPGLVQAGMDCLQAMEVKAGMHMPAILIMDASCA